MIPGWRVALVDFIASRIAVPFSWGHQDCCLFAADGIEVMTGRDPAATFRGAYKEAMGAARVMQALGGLEAIADRYAGMRVSPEHAQIGDIGLVSNGGRPCLSVFGGEYFHCPGEHGLTIVPRRNCITAWKPE